MESVMRQTGIDVIGDVPWGTHFCQFYESSQDLIETLVPYFKEGLASNEFCMWVTSEPLKVDQATTALRAAVPNLDDYIDKGQIEILDYSQWYTRSGKFSADEVLQGWVDKLKAAQEQGYEGLRLTGNTFWLEKADWDDFTRYEETVNSVIGRYPMLAICTYSLQKCNAVELLDVVANHQFALIKRSGRWEIIESAQHKRTGIALQKSEDRFATTLASIGDAVITTDIEGKITFMNGVAEKLTGWKLDDASMLPAKTVFNIINEYTRIEVDDPITKVLDNGTIVGLANHTILVQRDGSEVAIDDSGSPIRNRSGDIMGVVLVFRDVTEHRRSEDALRKSEVELRKAKGELEQRVQERTLELQNAKEELEVTNEELRIELEARTRLEVELVKAKEAAEESATAKGAFLANMSHELRTPMNAVLGFSSLLLDDNLTQEQKEYIEGIRKGGEALLALINDILDFSKAEKDKIELECQPFSLKHLIDESLDLVATQASKRGLNLSETINYGTPDTIIGDQGRLRQILVNLLSNAVKFTDKGNVSVSISSKAVEDDKHQIFFEVKDTGIGIPQDRMNELFEPFVQVERTLSRKRDGVGLGLAITKKLVELMGGRIWVESKPGQGTTFHLMIPAETIPGKQLDFGRMDSGIASESLPGLKSMRILVAEDNPSNQRVLVEMLKRLGYRADAVADGSEFIQALERQDYDLVLMDIKMPEMDGVTATKVIRKLRPVNVPKIVAITAFALEGDREKCLEAGMDDYIAKPVLIAELAEILRKYQKAQVGP